MFRKVDCVRLRVPDLDQGLKFYCEKLGHTLSWRRGNEEAGLRMPESETELVLFTDASGPVEGPPEVDLLVQSTDDAVAVLKGHGALVLQDPFDIPVGRCAVVSDPFGNRLVVLDLTKGLLKTDDRGRVIE